MIKIPFNPERLAAAGVQAERFDDSVLVTLPGETGGFYVQMIGDDMVLASERSAAQRKLLDLLSVNRPAHPSETGGGYGG